MKSVFFRGKPYTAAKCFFEGTHRILSPEETWEKILPFASHIGLTRVANITGLDRVGIPVTVAIRPNSRTLSTSSGKGVSLITAQVSGFMEALELHAAEEVDLPYFEMSYNQLCQEANVIPLSRLPYRKKSLFHPNWPEKWTKGWDIMQQKEVAAPLLSVILNFEVKRYEPKDLFSFDMSSNGLASGNHLLEAIASGIYEVVERDAITCSQFVAHTFSCSAPKIRLETIPYPSVLNLLGKLETAGFQTFLYDCSCDSAIPVFMAYTHDMSVYTKRVGAGYGAHLDPEVAMIRALTEAIQGRLVMIAGSRDDMFAAHTSSSRIDTFLLLKALKTSPATVDASTYYSQATPTLEEDIHLLLEKLKKIGIEQVLVFDLSEKELDIPVVRVLIPGLEGLYSAQHGERIKQLSSLKIAPAQSLLEEHKELLKIFAKTHVHLPAGGAL